MTIVQLEDVYGVPVPRHSTEAAVIIVEPGTFHAVGFASAYCIAFVVEDVAVTVAQSKTFQSRPESQTYAT
jgi:hypothetical protein